MSDSKVTAARRDLETAINDVGGLARVLLCIDSSAHNALDLPGALNYLGNRLQEHDAAAHDAFSRLLKLDEYAPVRGGAA